VGAHRDRPETWRVERPAQLHPHMLHSLTSNVRETPRMMLTEWVYGADQAAN